MDFFKRNEDDLLKNIMDLSQEIKTQNENVKKFKDEIILLVENKFKGINIMPSEEPNSGFYYCDDYIKLLNIQLDSIIPHIIDNSELNELKENIQYD